MGQVGHKWEVGEVGQTGQTGQTGKSSDPNAQFGAQDLWQVAQMAQVGCLGQAKQFGAQVAGRSQLTGGSQQCNGCSICVAASGALRHVPVRQRGAAMQVLTGSSRRQSCILYRPYGAYGASARESVPRSWGACRQECVAGRHDIAWEGCLQRSPTLVWRL